MTFFLLLLLSMGCNFWLLYVCRDMARECDRAEREFAELEVAWQQLRTAMRLYIADVEARRPKRGRNGRFVERNDG